MEWIGAHKWLVGGVVAGLMLLYLYANSGGSSGGAVASGVDPNADALSAAQLQAQTTVSGQQTALAAQSGQIQGSLDLARIQADTTDATNGLAAQVALSQIGEQSHVADLSAATTQGANTLNANVAMAGLSTQEHLATIQSNTSIQNQGILAGALTDQARISAGVSEAAISGQSVIEQQLIAAQGQNAQGQNYVAALNAQNNAPRSWWQTIFG